MEAAPEPRVEVTANGPYLVYGSVPITRRRPVVSEQGEPMTWQTTARLRTREAMALCRCGGSSHKPFCDGTHQSNGFDGTEAATTDTYRSRAKAYPGTGVVVSDDRSICEHAGFCGNHLSNVWKMVADTEDTIARAQMMHMIERCPSGALTYRMASAEGDAGVAVDAGVVGDVGGVGDVGDVEPEFGVAVAVTADGPYFVSGAIPVARSDGQPFEARNRVTLCRCGQSANKPLCDGTHKKVGFADS